MSTAMLMLYAPSSTCAFIDVARVCVFACLRVWMCLSSSCSVESFMAVFFFFVVSVLPVASLFLLYPMASILLSPIF